MTPPTSALAIAHNKLTAFRQLEPGVRSPLLQALALLPLIHAALKALGFQRTYGLLLKLSGTSTSTSVAQPTGSENSASGSLKLTVQAVQIASRYHPYATCLRRALVLWYLLRRQKMAAELRIGTRFHQGEFQAHAWVEWGGNVVGDRPDIAHHFPPFDTLTPMLKQFARSL